MAKGFWEDKFQREKFLNDLALAKMNAVTRFATTFVSDMEKLMRGNKDLKEMALPEWIPTAKQLNTLSRIARGDSV